MQYCTGMDDSDAGSASMATAVHRYFEAMDRGDIEATLECFTDDALLISEGQMHLKGKAAIRAFLVELAANSASMSHTVTGLVADATQRKAVAELRYTNARLEFADIDMENCNIFEFDETGRFTRVRFWVGDPAQLSATR